jgi:hypothetical protein
MRSPVVIPSPDIRIEIRHIALALVRRFVYGLLAAPSGRTPMEPTTDMKITLDTPNNADFARCGVRGAASIVTFAGRLAG